MRGSPGAASYSTGIAGGRLCDRSDCWHPARRSRAASACHDRSLYVLSTECVVVCPMFKALIGDLFASEAQTLTNTVNCVGVMGKGVALEFKKRFPRMARDYEARCARGEVRLG